jgi:carboxyl-terminal processing protease
MKITADRKVLLVVSTVLIVFIVSGAILGRAVALEGTYNALRVFNEALYLIVNNYVQPVSLDMLMEGSYRGLLESLDPGNEYLRPEQYQSASRGENAGPADVGLTLFKRRGYVVALAVRPGSPAAEAGLTSGDVIISIDGEPTRQMGVWAATQALRGAAGSTVATLVKPVDDHKRKTVELTRAIPPPTPPTGVMEVPEVGVVRIFDIDEGDARRLSRVIAGLTTQGARRLLLDMRGCAADSLAESIGMASLFVGEGTIVTVTDPHAGDKAYKADGRRLAWNGPLALLVDEGTSRACEVLTAALRDRIEAPILGETTWGIGSHHELLPLRSGGGVILAVGRYLSPSGKDWNGQGITPDLKIPGQVTDEDDPQRRKAIDYLRGMSAVPSRRDAA